MTLISTGDSAHDFIVKLIKCSVVASLTGEIVAYHAHGTAVTNPAVVHGLCAMTKR